MATSDKWTCTCVNCNQPCDACQCGDDAVWVERCPRCNGTVWECECESCANCGAEIKKGVPGHGWERINGVTYCSKCAREVTQEITETAKLEDAWGRYP